MNLIAPSDPRYFTQTSDGPYDRHEYKVVAKSGESFITDDYMQAQAAWFEKGIWLSHIEVLDKPKKQKGFK